MESVDAIVIGAGVVGLAVARALAKAGRGVLILETEDAFGTHTSSRNSEVIHAGIYYPKGSLKASLCVEGKQRLYRYCQEHGVAHRRIGKLLVATHDGERDLLASYAKKAAANGVTLEPMGADEVRALEPEVRATAALWSESTGIVDVHGLMLALLGDAEQAGAVLVTRTPVTGVTIANDGFVVRTGGDDPMMLRCELLVNSAGLNAQAVAASFDGFARRHLPPTYYAKGHYFTLAHRSPFRHLVYPMPDPGGLGIHVTLDLGGQCKFGPDVSGWPEHPDYSFDTGLEAKFYGAIRRYWPALADGDLQPGYTGIRPKISGPDEAAADFLIQGPSIHGVRGLVNLFGIESPGLTSALSIADMVASMALDREAHAAEA